MDINYLDIIDNFHFIRPWFLAAMLPLLVVIYFLRKQVRSQSGWQGVLASHLYDNLVSTESGKQSSPPWLLLFAGWLLTCLALAGPTWEKLPQPVYQVSKGKVILVDMSMSMRAEDIKPNRLSRVRFKAMDLLDALQEGETGMVAYAGDAFVISPLTSDVQNIEALIPSLSPEIMPSQGSDAVFALETTFELLKNAGYQEGDIFWITDGIELSEVAPLRNLLSDNDYRINILAVGTEDGAPIKIANGNFLKDRSGAVVIPKLRTSALSTISRSSGGRFVVSRPDDADISYLTEARLEPQEGAAEQEEDDNSFGDQWKEFGPWLLLLLLPVAAYGFRRGVLPVFLLFVLIDGQRPVYAQEDEVVRTAPQPDNNWWNDLWQTRNQQGAESFQNNDFLSAAQQFEDPTWKGLSHFNAGNYEQAAEVYSTMDTPDGNFGLGNALAQNQQYQEAIAAYERTLELDPDYPNAAENKQYLEDLMEQEQQNQDQQQDSEQDQEQDDSEQNQDQQQDSEQDSQQDESQQDQQNQDQQNQDQQQENSQDEQQNQDQQQQDSEQEQQENDEQQQEQESEQSEQEQSEQEMQEQEAQMQEPEELTDEQKEQLQKIENWLRKVPDDPAYLLKRKMLLEQQRRQRQRLPATEQKNW